MIRLLGEEADFLLFYKPAGMDFHSSQGEPGFFRRACALRPGETLYPVHRLDKMTSGLILTARSPEAAARLGRLFEQRQVRKFYLALSRRKPRKKQGLIKGDMVRSRRSAWKLTRRLSDPAVTYFYSRALPPQPGEEAQTARALRIFLLRIYTGKTHQIRVAMKSLGAPVWGDPLYGSEEDRADRGYLHAWQIGFTWNQRDFLFRCDPEEGEFFREGARLLPRDWLRPDDLAWPGL